MRVRGEGLRWPHLDQVLYHRRQQFYHLHVAQPREAHGGAGEEEVTGEDREFVCVGGGGR